MRFLEFAFFRGCSCWNGRDPPITDKIPLSPAATDAPNKQPDVSTPSSRSPPLNIIPPPDPNLASSSSANPASISISPICARPGENVTKDALHNLIVDLENRIEQLRSTSAAREYSSQVWEEYTSDVPGFLQRLDEREEATAVEIAKDTALPLLVEVLQGIGSLHWMAFGCSMLAWGIDKVDRQHENFNDCLQLLKDALFLVKDTRDLCDHLDQTMDTTTSHRTSKDMMKSILPEIGEVAFSASAICVSCSRDRFASLITRYLGAPTLEKAISKLNDRMKTLQGQNNAIGREIAMNRSKRNMVVMNRPLSGYHTLEEEDSLLGRRQLLDEMKSIFKMDSEQEQQDMVVVAVCLHGMGGVGKSTLALTIFDKLVRQLKFVSCHVEMELESEHKDVPVFQEQILQEMNSHKRGDQMFRIPNAVKGREMLLREFKRSTGTPILLYIDNLEHPEFLLELFPNLTHLPMGSKLLITSRNEKVGTYLHQLGVEEDRCHSILVKTLDVEHSRNLLRKEALIKVKDKHILDNNWKLRDMEDQVLRLCDGLPLALKLMGSFIAYSARGGAESVDTWKHVVSAMEEARPVDGMKKDKLYARLRVSIDALDESLRSHLFELVAWKLYQETWKPSEALDMVQLKFIFGAEEMQNLIERHLLEEVEGMGDDHRSRFLDCHDIIVSLVKRMVSEDGGEHHALHVIKGLSIGNFAPPLSQEDAEEGKLANTGFIEFVEVTDVQLQQMKRLRYALHIFVRTTSAAVNDEVNLPDLKVLVLTITGGRLKLRRCPNLRLLHVFGGDFVDLEDLVAPNLHELHCDRGILKNFPRWIPHFSDLRSLHLTKTDWGGLPYAISTIRTLSYLTLSECKSLQTIPDEISMLTALTNLDLRGCESVRCIPEGIRELKSLLQLTLRRCKYLEALPHGIRMLTALRKLDLGGCESMSCIPDGIRELTSLSSLYLSGCILIEALPEGISMLTALKEIYMGGCQSLRHLPEGFSMLTALKEIHMGGCRWLRCIPKGIGELKRLSYLNLIGCTRLEELPEGISMLTALKELHLEGCESLRCIPEGILMIGSFKKKLDLTECKSLRCIPEGISMLTSLSSLRLRGCTCLEALPEGISMLTALEMLDLRGCESLRCIPEGIRGLKGLSWISLKGCNRLEALPDGISMLTALRELHLGGCESLRSIPEGICDLTNLTSLDLRL